MGPHITKDKPVSHKDFFALVYDRLAAVMKDHEAMKRRVQDMGREEGRTYEDIMVGVVCRVYNTLRACVVSTIA